MPHQSRALVVDDDANILSAFEDFFRKEHCAMLSASSAEEALRAIAGVEVNLVITDIKLPWESGVALCRKLKATRPLLPVIVITGYPNLVSEEDARRAGADFYFLKPLELDQLREAVRKCLHATVYTAVKRS
jgi:two-component system nitrogen regulation response regulator GlnG